VDVIEVFIDFLLVDFEERSRKVLIVDFLEESEGILSSIDGTLKGGSIAGEGSVSISSSGNFVINGVLGLGDSGKGVVDGSLEI